MKCMISIVLPTYNGSQYIDESIQSILKQTYNDFELVIVNDASTDNTLEIIKKYAESDSRIKIISNESNKKLPASLNIGFSSCSGEFYTWTSDDNIYLPEALEVMMKEFEADEELGFVFAGEKLINEKGKVVAKRKKRKDLDELYTRNIITACFLYRSMIHEDLNGYDVTKFLIEDYDFFLRAYMKYKFKYVHQYLYLYREHGSSLTTTRREEIKNISIEFLKDVLTKVDDTKIESKIKKGISNYYLDLSDIYYQDVRYKNNKNDVRDMLKKRLHIFATEILGR